MGNNSHSLIERIKGSNGEEALKWVYSQYRNEFLQWATRNHDCSLDEAKDVFQQAIVIFYERVVGGKLSDINAQVKTYLFGIGKNKIFELVRARSKHTIAYDYQLRDESFYESDNSVTVYDSQIGLLEKCLDQLGDPCKTILVRYYYQKLSMTEISESMAYKNSETVKNLKYKCLQRLKRMFRTVE